MILFHIVILAIVQGITELLPISSSGHLLLTHRILDTAGTAEDELIMDVGVHIGTLFAVLLYFRTDVLRMISAALSFVLRRGSQTQDRLFIYIMAGSLPVVAAGLVLHLLEPSWMRSLYLSAICTIIFGILLWVADRFRPSSLALSEMTIKRAFLIGCAQVLALMPGVSRSGITMTAARTLGFSRTEAARFSFLLAAVAISGAGLLKGIEVFQTSNVTMMGDVAVGAFLSFFSSLAAIIFLMRWLQKATFTPFAIYRVLLGVVLLGLIHQGVLQP